MHKMFNIVKRGNKQGEQVNIETERTFELVTIEIFHDDDKFYELNNKL
jgi:hypothetical protein